MFNFVFTMCITWMLIFLIAILESKYRKQILFTLILIIIFAFFLCEYTFTVNYVNNSGDARILNKEEVFVTEYATYSDGGYRVREISYQNKILNVDSVEYKDIEDILYIKDGIYKDKLGLFYMKKDTLFLPLESHINTVISIGKED